MTLYEVSSNGYFIMPRQHIYDCNCRFSKVKGVSKDIIGYPVFAFQYWKDTIQSSLFVNYWLLGAFVIT